MEIGTCKHLTSTWHDTHCKAGVCYRDVTNKPDEPGSAYRIPCRRIVDAHGRKVRDELGPPGTCDKYEDPTPEEVAEYEAAIEALIARSEKSIPVMLKVKKEHEGKDWKGVEPCPVCGGNLHLSHAAYNGHVWGKCETKDCLAWME